jgi:hypothetical protein
MIESYPYENEFHYAVTEVPTSVGAGLENNMLFHSANIVESYIKPEVIGHRAAWVDGQREAQIDFPYALQMFPALLRIKTLFRKFWKFIGRGETSEHADILSDESPTC